MGTRLVQGQFAILELQGYPVSESRALQGELILARILKDQFRGPLAGIADSAAPRSFQSKQVSFFQYIIAEARGESLFLLGAGIDDAAPFTARPSSFVAPRLDEVFVRAQREGDPLFAIIMGLRRINKTEILQYNGAFLEMLGFQRFPDQSSLRRFLKRLPPKTIRQLARLHDSLRAYLFSLPNSRTTLVFDLDSVVIVIYGQAEGAIVGYNPKKPRRRSYPPLLCFEAHFQEFWHGSLRPGNT